ncbi:MAG: hypothetical protein WBG70_24065 [Spirulinaceae cyanobacterium]
MDTFNRYGEIIESILQEYAAIPYRYGDVTTFVIVSRVSVSYARGLS